ncbi:MAG: hypothetical protein HC836_36175 [Richelia sp. RM2_1_2]|nr:hypothetical protein [Richelia sp. RM2_1_2]
MKTEIQLMHIENNDSLSENIVAEFEEASDAYIYKLVLNREQYFRIFEDNEVCKVIHGAMFINCDLDYMEQVGGDEYYLTLIGRK